MENINNSDSEPNNNSNSKDENCENHVSLNEVRSESVMISHTLAMALAENKNYIEAFQTAKKSFKKLENHKQHKLTEQDIHVLDELWKLICSIAIDRWQKLRKNNQIPNLMAILKQMALSRMLTFAIYVQKYTNKK